MRQFTLDLPHQPWCGPNGRSWRKRWDYSQAWRRAAKVLAKTEGLPALERATVTLRCRPGDKRGRDTDSIALVAKWCTDGLVDAGVLSRGDRAEFVPEVKLQMEPPGGSWRWLLIVRELP